MASPSGSSGGRRRSSGNDGGGSVKKPRRAANLELEIFQNPNLLAYPGWENEPEPWTCATAQIYVGFPHIDRLWPERCHEQHCKAKGARYNNIENVETKWRFLTILRAISNLERWPKNSIPRCILSTMYAEHVLRKSVNWSTLRGNGGKFGSIGDSLAVRTPAHIPYSPVPEWFRANPGLYDEPGQPLPMGREQWASKWRRNDARENDTMDMTIEEAFDTMEVEAPVDTVQTSNRDVGQSSIVVSQDSALGVSCGEHGGHFSRNNNSDVAMELELNDTVHNEVAATNDSTPPTTDESLQVIAQMRDEHSQSVNAFKARITLLEARLATFGIHEDGGSSNVMLTAPSVGDSTADVDANMAGLIVERDAALERSNASELYASELFEANRLLRDEVYSLKNLPYEAENMELRAKVSQLQYDLDEANIRAAVLEIGRDNTEQLREENCRLKQCLTEALDERIAMRQSTIMAVARARQYESEFESIVSEWNTNGRLRTLLLTSWASEETMFPSSWDMAEPSLYLADNISINWKKIEDPEHHWDVDARHDYPARMAGKQLWSNPHPSVSNSDSCPICTNPFGPEGFYTVATCGHKFHPPCLIKWMILHQTCSLCRAPFHPRLYLQFGLKDFMPSHWVYRPSDFPFDLAGFNGENIEWSWKYNMSKVQLWAENQDGPWVRSMSKVLYAANELYPNKPPDYPLKLFFYQTLQWHWDSSSNELKRGIKPPFLNSSGEIATTTLQLRRQYRGLGDLEASTATDDLVFEENYHRARLMLNAIDAILHKVSPEMKTWLEGGSKPSRRTIVSPSSRVYRTRRTAREIAQAGGASSSSAPSAGQLEDPVVEMGVGHIIQWSDSDRDSDSD